MNNDTHKIYLKYKLNSHLTIFVIIFEAIKNFSFTFVSYLKRFK